MAISLSEFQRRIILSPSNWQDSCLSCEYLITLFPSSCLLISSSLSLSLSLTVAQFQSSTAPFGSAFGLLRLSSFSHSASLCLLNLHPVCPRHNSRGRSLFMRVLSHSDTHHLNRHMAGCGCHEILIQRCISVLFLSSIFLYPIGLWFWWLSYSNHSFRHPIEPRLTIRDKSPIAIRTERANLLQLTVKQIHSVAKSEVLTVWARLHKCLPSNSKYRRHETMSVTSINNR